MDIVKDTTYAQPLKRLRSKNGRSLMSERYAFCFAQKSTALLSDNDNNDDDAGLTATANDNVTGPNGPALNNALDNMIVTAALRLFGQYGLASADHALEKAERCFWANDPLGHKWWMSVLRQLDNNLVANTKKYDADKSASPMNITGNS